MVYAVYIASSESKRGQPVRQRFCRYHYNMRQASFAITDQVQRFSPTVLRSVTAHGKLCGHACMKDWFASIRFPNIGHLAGIVVYDAPTCIDLGVFIQIAINHDVRRHKIIISEGGGQLRVLSGKGVQVSKMFILSKVASFQPVIIPKLENCPPSRTQILQLRESLLKKLRR